MVPGKASEGKTVLFYREPEVTPPDATQPHTPTLMTEYRMALRWFRARHPKVKLYCCTVNLR